MIPKYRLVLFGLKNRLQQFSTQSYSATYTDITKQHPVINGSKQLRKLLQVYALIFYMFFVVGTFTLFLQVIRK